MTTFGPTAGVSLRAIPERRATLPDWVRTQDDLRLAMMGKGPGDTEEPAKPPKPHSKRSNKKIGPLILRYLLDYGAATNFDIIEELGASSSGVNRRLRALEKAGHVEILRGTVHKGHGEHAVWAITEAGTAFIDSYDETGRWRPGPDTLAGRVLAYIEEHGEATVAQAGEAVGKRPRLVGKVMTDLSKAGYIKSLRKDGKFVVWGLT